MGTGRRGVPTPHARSPSRSLVDTHRGPPGTAAPTPVVKGQDLVDSTTGKTLVLRGVNWPSFEYACVDGYAYARDNRGPRAMAQIAARFYGDPTATLKVVGITGTNGKTTSAFLTRALLEGAGLSTGLFFAVLNKIFATRTRQRPS